MLKKLWPAMLWAVGVLVLIGMPSTYIPKTLSFLDWASPDKVVHFVLFGGQSFLLLYGFKEQYFEGKGRYVLIAAAISVGIVYGLLTEIMQYYVFVGRNGNYLDFIADAIGAFIGFVAFYLIYRKKIVNIKVNKN